MENGVMGHNRLGSIEGRRSMGQGYCWKTGLLPENKVTVGKRGYCRKTG